MTATYLCASCGWTGPHPKNVRRFAPYCPRCAACVQLAPPLPPVPTRPPAVCCGYCGKDEQDGVGVIVMGACDDCRRVWA